LKNWGQKIDANFLLPISKSNECHNYKQNRLINATVEKISSVQGLADCSGYPVRPHPTSPKERRKKPGLAPE